MKLKLGSTWRPFLDGRAWRANRMDGARAGSFSKEPVAEKADWSTLGGGAGGRRIRIINDRREHSRGHTLEARSIEPRDHPGLHRRQK